MISLLTPFFPGKKNRVKGGYNILEKSEICSSYMQIDMSNFKSDLWIDPNPFVDIMLV